METLIIYCNHCSLGFRFYEVDDLIESKRHHKLHFGGYEE